MGMRRSHRAGLALLAISLIAACPTPEVRRASAGAEERGLPNAMRQLAVPGFLPAVLFVPPGVEPRPLVVAAHGAGGSPEWECEYWRRLTNDSRFVLCLRGRAMGRGGGYYYPNEHALEAELEAALQSLRAAEPRASIEGGLYAGFSQGASMGSAILAKHGDAFSSLALVEGFQAWNVPRAKTFAERGGKRILFVCGTKQCQNVAILSARWLERGGIHARVEYAAGAGHTPLGPVLSRLAVGLPWLLDAN